MMKIANLLNVAFLVFVLTTPATGQSIEWDIEEKKKTLEEAKEKVEALARQNMKDFGPLRSEAAQGDVNSQLRLGRIYHKTDKQEAIMWFHLAAEQGDANAQAWLGSMYMESAVGMLIRGSGDRGRRDSIKGCKWFLLAAEQGVVPKGSEGLIKEMFASEFAECQRLAREWQPKLWEQIEETLNDAYEEWPPKSPEQRTLEQIAKDKLLEQPKDEVQEQLEKDKLGDVNSILSL